MKIAVCVKEVPEAGPSRRIDAGTMRMDRSGDRSLNQFDLNAIEEAIRLRDAAGEGEVVLVSMGPSRALESIRKGLAMGADRAVLVSDDGSGRLRPGGHQLRAGQGARARAPDLVLFGQQASDSDGAVLWAAVADRLRLPVISQISELEVADGAVTAKRQTEFGYDRIRAPLPAVLAVSDALNEPRYPSLKGIMGAKKKAAGDAVPGRRRRRGRPGRRGRLAHPRARPEPAALARGHDEDRGRRQRGREDHGVPHGEEARMSTLVFLEHHGSALQKGPLGVLAKAASLDPETGGRLIGAGVG